MTLASSRKWISDLFGATGHTRMQWRAVLEQLLIFTIAGWSLDAAAPTAPYSSSLQDSQILPVLLVLLVLLFTSHHCFCSGDEQEILERDFLGLHSHPCSLPVLGRNCCRMPVWGVWACRVHTCIQAFPSLLLWLRCVSGLLTAAYFTSVSVQLKCNLFFLYH